MRPKSLLWCATALLLASCATPPLTLYTLGAPPIAADTAPLGRRPVVIAVARVTVPDELDTEDIVVRDGSTLRRSTRGRWASRLSLGITDRLTERLAERRPDALVTDRPLTDTPSVSRPGQHRPAGRDHRRRRDAGRRLDDRATRRRRPNVTRPRPFHRHGTGRDRPGCREAGGGRAGPTCRRDQYRPAVRRAGATSRTTSGPSATATGHVSMSSRVRITRIKGGDYSG